MDAGVVTSKKMAVTLLTFRMNFDADFWIAATDQTYAGEKSKVLRVRLGMMLHSPRRLGDAAILRPRSIWKSTKPDHIYGRNAPTPLTNGSDWG